MARRGISPPIQEDRVLKVLVEERGIKSWAEIAKLMASEFLILERSGKQCRERYHNHLDTKIKHGPWSRQEEQLLVEMQNSFGNRWADISRGIAGRYLHSYPDLKTRSRTSTSLSSVAA